MCEKCNCKNNEVNVKEFMKFLKGARFELEKDLKRAKDDDEQVSFVIKVMDVLNAILVNFATLFEINDTEIDTIIFAKDCDCIAFPNGFAKVRKGD